MKKQSLNRQKTKHFKILDPKDDKFSNVETKKLQLQKTVSDQRHARAIVYNKLIELVHLNDRKAIRALPLDKKAFAKALSQLAKANVPEENRDDVVKETILNNIRTEKFEAIFAKHALKLK